MTLIDTLKIAVKKHVVDDSFESKWHQAASAFETWKSSEIGRSTSNLIARLQLFQFICSAFPEAKLAEERTVGNLLLVDSGAKKIGDTFRCRLPNGRMELTTVVGREVSKQFGVLYTLETAEGFRFTHEFFD